MECGSFDFLLLPIGGASCQTCRSLSCACEVRNISEVMIYLSRVHWGTWMSLEFVTKKLTCLVHVTNTKNPSISTHSIIRIPAFIHFHYWNGKSLAVLSFLVMRNFQHSYNAVPAMVKTNSTTFSITRQLKFAQKPPKLSQNAFNFLPETCHTTNNTLSFPPR